MGAHYNGMKMSGLVWFVIVRNFECQSNRQEEFTVSFFQRQSMAMLGLLFCGMRIIKVFREHLALLKITLGCLIEFSLVSSHRRAKVFPSKSIFHFIFPSADGKIAWITLSFTHLSNYWDILRSIHDWFSLFNVSVICIRHRPSRCVHHLNNSNRL